MVRGVTTRNACYMTTSSSLSVTAIIPFSDNDYNPFSLSRRATTRSTIASIRLSLPRTYLPTQSTSMLTLSPAFFFDNVTFVCECEMSMIPKVRSVSSTWVIVNDAPSTVT